MPPVISRMHKNVPFRDTNSKNFLGRGRTLPFVHTCSIKTQFFAVVVLEESPLSLFLSSDPVLVLSLDHKSSKIVNALLKTCLFIVLLLCI